MRDNVDELFTEQIRQSVANFFLLVAKGSATKVKNGLDHGDFGVQVYHWDGCITELACQPRCLTFQCIFVVLNIYSNRLKSLSAVSESKQLYFTSSKVSWLMNDIKSVSLKKLTSSTDCSVVVSLETSGMTTGLVFTLWHNNTTPSTNKTVRRFIVKLMECMSWSPYWMIDCGIWELKTKKRVSNIKFVLLRCTQYLL